MTNNEKVKRAINQNMASIYTALEQVGAPLPEKKNLQNVAPAIKSAFNSKELAENIAYAKQMDMIDSISGVRTISDKNYSTEEIQRLETILITLTEGKNG